MLRVVSILSCALGTLSFLLFAFLAIVNRRGKSDQHTNPQLEASLGDIAKLIEALAKLTDSLQKAGPMVASLIGAIFFLLLAALTGGLAK